MDAAADDDAAFLRGGEGGRHQCADRREDQRRVERLGRRGCRIPGPFGAETTREILRQLVARPGESENPAALVASDLGDNMGGGAETVDPDGARSPAMRNVR